MKTIFTIVGLLFIGINSASCSTKQHPKDFGFILIHGMGPGDTLDTFKSRITKSIDYDRDISTTFILSASQLDTVYTLMKDIDFFNYPTNFGALEPSITPTPTYIFRVHLKGSWKTVKWQCGLQSENKQSTYLHKLIDLILRYIWESNEYKNLPDSKIFYE